MMHAIDPLLERLLRHLAHKLKYELSDGEVNLYRQELTKYPFWALADVCLEAEMEYREGMPPLYPSLAYFKKKLQDGRIKPNQLRA